MLLKFTLFKNSIGHLAFYQIVSLTIINIILPLSLVFIMFSLGLNLTTSDFKNVARQPKIFTIVLINKMVLLPIVAFGLITMFGFSKEMAVAIATGIQNATVGITVGNLILSNSEGLSVLSLPSGVYGILMYIVCLPIVYLYVRLIRSKFS